MLHVHMQPIIKGAEHSYKCCCLSSTIGKQITGVNIRTSAGINPPNTTLTGL